MQLNLKNFYNRFYSLLLRVYRSRFFLQVILCCGVILRVSQYLFNRSLWMDEAYLALNIIHRSFYGLLVPLDYDQAAPIGFLIVQKCMILLFGVSDYVFRFFPLLCGLVSLYVFYLLAVCYLEKSAIPIALALFVVSDKLIYYSSEVKPYSIDVLAVLLFYLITIYLQSKRLTLKVGILYGLLGGILIWFSFPIVFILAGIGISLVIQYQVTSKRWWCLLISYLIWMISFLVLYFLSFRALGQSGNLHSYWEGNFMPFPPKTWDDLELLMTTVIDFFGNPGGFLFSGLAMFAFLVGCVSMALRDGWKFIFLMAPLPFMLVASMLQRYPLSGRLLLFYVPLVLLLIAEGAISIKSNTYKAFPFIGLAFIGFVLFLPVKDAVVNFVRPRTVEEIKPVLRYLDAHWQPSDNMYIYYGAWPAVQYYMGECAFSRGQYTVGEISRDSWQHYFYELDTLYGHERVWILFSHVYTSGGANERALMLFYLDQIGQRLDAFESQNASIYLYNLASVSSP